MEDSENLTIKLKPQQQHHDIGDAELLSTFTFFDVS